MDFINRQHLEPAWYIFFFANIKIHIVGLKNHSYFFASYWLLFLSERSRKVVLLTLKKVEGDEM